MPEMEFYDRLGRVVRKVAFNQNGSKVYVDYSYDHKCRQVSATEPYIPGESYLVTITEYDDLGRIERVVEPGEIRTGYS